MSTSVMGRGQRQVAFYLSPCTATVPSTPGGGKVVEEGHELLGLGPPEAVCGND